MTHAIRLTDHWTRDGLRWQRRFGAPRLQAAGETVWLVGGPVVSGTLSVNGTQFVVDGPFEIEITPLLQPRNEAVLELAEAPEPWPEIRLEIRS